MVFECHGHIMLDGISYPEAVERHRNGVDEAFVRKNLQVNADHGIAFFRDGGDKYGVTAFARKIAGEYGIDYRTPTFLIHKKGHYGGMFGQAFETLVEYRKLVDEAKGLGADFIKLTASGMLDFNDGGAVTGQPMELDELKEMIKIAHGEGFAVMIHVNGADNIRRSAEAGADSIEHGFFIDDDALGILKQTGAVWVPTSVAVGNLIGTGRYNDAKLLQIFQGHKASLKKAKEMDVLVACGSDVGTGCVLPGKGTLEELAVLDSVGLYPESGNRKIEEVFKREC